MTPPSPGSLSSASLSKGAGPETAMVLAAGRGTRMGHLTDDRPKPLVEVAGTPLLDFSLRKLEQAGIKRIVVNVHYKAGQIREYLARRKAEGAPSEIMISDETGELLETGGGVKNALGLLGDEPFYVVNSDIMWLDGVSNGFELLAERWCADTMDALLLLSSATSAIGYKGRGDFLLAPDGAVTRRPEREVAPFVFAGVQIAHPRLFAKCPDGPFSLNLAWDHAAVSNRLYGVRREGVWFHVGSPEAVKSVESWLSG